MLKMEQLINEGKAFLNECHYAELDDMAKMNVNAYMKGLIDGRRLAQARNADRQKLEKAKMAMV